MGVASFFDMLQIAFSWFGGGWLIIPIQYGTLILWFRFHGLNFLSMKRAPTLGIGALIETVTAGIFPAFTAVVARIAFTEKIKEKVDTAPAGKVVGRIGPKVDNDQDMEKAA